MVFLLSHKPLMCLACVVHSTIVHRQHSVNTRVRLRHLASNLFLPPPSPSSILGYPHRRAVPQTVFAIFSLLFPLVGVGCCSSTSLLNVCRNGWTAAGYGTTPWYGTWDARWSSARHGSWDASPRFPRRSSRYAARTRYASSIGPFCAQMCAYGTQARWMHAKMPARVTSRQSARHTEACLKNEDDELQRRQKLQEYLVRGLGTCRTFVCNMQALHPCRAVGLTSRSNKSSKSSAALVLSAENAHFEGGLVVFSLDGLEIRKKYRESEIDGI